MKLLSTVFLVVFFVSGLIACKSESDDFEDLSNPTPDSISVGNSATPAAATPLPAIPPPAITLPQAPAGLPNQVGQRPLTNPSHGLPYHDCSIEVGAPLADKGNAAKPAMPGFTPTLPDLQPTPAGVKLNPAHGKPGHRCEIAVGAPLS
ncbi:hypothetical protein [Flavitalea sp.]|nr:hypothetical protein [Flavitalea sp.]